MNRLQTHTAPNIFQPSGVYDGKNNTETYPCLIDHRALDLNSFNAGNYEGAIESSNSAAAITSVLYPNDNTSCDRERFARMSLIEEGSPQQVRMAHLACIGSCKVNGVAELHSDLVKTTILKDFMECYGILAGLATLPTAVITPHRWLDQCNPTLSALISSTLKIPKEVWLKDLPKLEGLLAHVDDPKLAKAWAEIKQANKERLAHWMQVNLVYLLAESTLSS
ncbi:glycosyltransferase family 35 protein [Athelia psychrophila]|uniref:Alpha-1,4 glucan phosphorylase n=1 Tax=Athelia psychrophila TaxID=1759441 RepID=A0A165Z1F2_9AGAM|nr:glycosyltransferase family 35 protein [Fibularhizoctonia sp. CBS 109695]